jgi:hypothetical protein
MKILLDQAVNNSAEGPSPQSGRVSASPAAPRPAQSSPAPEVIPETQKSAPVAAILQANVTFRRDPQGRIYYVITDAQSGKEIRELPPAEVRKVGAGIDEYLKQEAAKTQQHVEVKA